MKISKRKLKILIEKYLKEDNEEGIKDKLSQPLKTTNDVDLKIGEALKIKELDTYASKILKNYKNKQLGRLLDQIRSDGNPYIRLKTGAGAMKRTLHVFVKKIPGYAKDSHERIGVSGTIAMFKYTHSFIERLEPVGEISKQNYDKAMAALNTIKDEKDVLESFGKVIPIIVLNYQDLSSRGKDTSGESVATKSVVEHEFDHIKSFVLNAFLNPESGRINIETLRTIIRDDLKNASISEYSAKIKEENKDKIDQQYLSQIARQTYDYYKDVFDNSYTDLPGQADEISARLHQLINSGHAEKIFKNYKSGKKKIFPDELSQKYKLQQNIQEILPLLKKDLTFQELKQALDRLAKQKVSNKIAIPV